MTCGINRVTGRPLAGWPHVLQCLVVIFTTRIGSRILARAFGSAVPGLLARNLTLSTLLKFWTAIVIAIDLWEPRYRVRQINYPAAQNTPTLLRSGKLGFQLVGDYRPRALEGDFTVETVGKTVSL